MQPRPWPGSLLLCPENFLFSPLQPEHTGCGGHFQLFGICDAGSGQPIPTNQQLAVTPHPIGRQILPLLAGYTRPILGLAPSGPLQAAFNFASQVTLSVSTVTQS